MTLGRTMIRVLLVYVFINNNNEKKKFNYTNNIIEVKEVTFI